MLLPTISPGNRFGVQLADGNAVLPHRCRLMKPVAGFTRRKSDQRLANSAVDERLPSIRSGRTSESTLRQARTRTSRSRSPPKLVFCRAWASNNRSSQALALGSICRQHFTDGCAVNGPKRGRAATGFRLDNRLDHHRRSLHQGSRWDAVREAEVMMISRQDASAPKLHLAWLWLICLVAAMGGLLFGYDWVVIGGAKPFYEPYFEIVERPFAQGLAMSGALFGCLFGAAASGALTDRYGRKRLLIASAFLFTASAVGTALAPGFILFIVARLIGGVGIGLASNLSPMYIAEISPARLRGRFVSVNQLTIVIGILAAQLVNWWIARGAPSDATPAELVASWYGQAGWRWMFAAGTFPALAFFVLMFFVPESPRWLAKAGRFGEAERILGQIGDAEYASAEVASIRQTLASEEIGHVHFRDLLAPDVSRVLALGIGLAILQQWCGINVIFNYAQEVFAAAGYDLSGIMQTIVITGVVNMLFTFVAIYTVDRLGRRALMLFGTAGLALIYTVLGTAYFSNSRGLHVLVLIVAAIAVYAMSLAPVTWVVIAEIFPNRIRGAAMSVAVLALWTACTVLTFTFPYLNLYLGPHGTFWFYAGICALGFLFVWRRLPETKDKSLEQIEAELAT